MQRTLFTLTNGTGKGSDGRRNIAYLKETVETIDKVIRLTGASS